MLSTISNLPCSLLESETRFILHGNFNNLAWSRSNLINIEYIKACCHGGEQSIVCADTGTHPASVPFQNTFREVEQKLLPK